MRKLLFLLFLLFPVMAYAQPSIDFDSEAYDFDVVYGRTALYYSFEVYNRGTEDLIIDKLYAS
jgi:hypothetical protein